MIDLIDESGKDLKKYGYNIRHGLEFGVSLASLLIDSEEKSRQLDLAKGQYYIFNSPFLHQLQDDNEVYLSKMIARTMRKLLKNKNVTKKDKILIACLGNPEIEADRLGKEVFDNIEISTLKKDVKLFKFCPNIYLFTGVETAKIVKMFVANLGVKCVVIIDSLTTANLSRLGVSFQLTSNGMTPGSGVNRFGKAIDENFLNAKCISIGVPFMVSSRALRPESEEIILVPKDVTQEVKRAGKVIANAISEVFL